MARPSWITDFLIVTVFAGILAVLSVVNIHTLRETYDQTERIQTVNQYVDCLDPTTPCGKKVAEREALEREFLTETMQNQAICTLLTSRSVRDDNDMVGLERVYDECVEARAKPPPPPSESPVEKKTEKKD